MPDGITRGEAENAQGSVRRPQQRGKNAGRFNRGEFTIDHRTILIAGLLMQCILTQVMVYMLQTGDLEDRKRT
jgi:hypothetical protein